MLARVDESWEETLKKCLSAFDSEYLEFLKNDTGYIPKKGSIFNTFVTLPKDRVKYILFGQDPYPRAESATGYAFIDGRVEAIFSPKGLSKDVNRATSLRNFIKMALVADGRLNCDNLSQDAIAKIKKDDLINSIDQLRLNFEKNGVLLLNTALIFTSKNESKSHIKSWIFFIKNLLKELKEQNPTLILFGTFAKDMKKRFDLDSFETVELKHPYNHSFICDDVAIKTFGKMKLLQKEQK
jgi:uracil-DNA glycosylase